MKNITVLISLFIFTVFANYSCGQQSNEKSISADELHSSLNNKRLIIIDVRTAEEFSEGHLPSAKNIDFNSADFSSRIDSLDKSAEYVLYCRSGRRSGEAFKIMDQKGFKNIRNVKGGITDWTAKGYETIK